MKRFLLLTVAAALCSIAPIRVFAEDVGGPGAWTREVVDAILRPVFINKMTDRYIAGAAVSVVKDGAMVYAQGFGRREVFQERPVSAQETIFRIGSVTKVLTGIAVMQLVDAGKVHLDDDVNLHLQSIHVDGPFDEPVRVRHLLTHTAGFDQLGYGRHAAGPDSVLPLAEFLRGNLVRIRPPGELAIYDTYAVTLAGVLVEDVSGVAYEDYLQRHIFTPLGMTRSGIAVPTEFRDDIATGYGFAGEWEPMPWEYMNTAPASSVNSTVTDMARLMIALLEGGACDGARILSRESTGAMLATQFRNDPRLPGYGLILMEDRREGVAAMSHGGSMAGFGCFLYLVPSEHLGVFVACNQESATLADAVVPALTHAMLPQITHAAEQLPRRRGGGLARVTGSYTSAMCNHTRPEKGGWKATPVEVAASDNGAIVFQRKRAYPVGNLLFQREDGTLIVFQADENDHIVRMLVGRDVYERRP